LLEALTVFFCSEQITTAELRCSNLGYKFVQLKEERHKQKIEQLFFSFCSAKRVRAAEKKRSEEVAI
jgi:hypothetical protein